MPTFFDDVLPESLKVLRDLSFDLRWSWNHYSDNLWSLINADVWEQTQNPVRVLHLTTAERFLQLSRDKEFMSLLQDVVTERQSYLDQSTWYSQEFPSQPIRHIAYFSMEFGLCEALPLYAGGLGVLAGDYLKTASDLGVPLVGVGLLYQQGYFRQSLGPEGWQRESYLYNDPSELPVSPVLQHDGSWLHIHIELFSRTLRFRVWRAQLGRIALYLLDSNCAANQPADRCITSALYSGGTELRLLQEIALGIGGWRLLEALGIPVDVCHLNEGHAAFATLERIRSYAQKHQLDFWQALWSTRAGNVFTTHTPVAAGFDRYSAGLLGEYVGQYASILGISPTVLMQLGQANPNDVDEPFNMAYLAMRTCAWSNGVSQLHGKVSQRIFQPLFKRWPEREVPVGCVTNGVHVPSWDSRAADQLWTQVLNKQRWSQPFNPADLNKFQTLSDATLTQFAADGRVQLVNYVRARFAAQHQFVDEQTCPLALEADVLTMGFARRFAEYKRPNLLLKNPDRLARLLSNPTHPVQLIVAGKAHPADIQGKQAIQEWYRFIQRPEVNGRVIFIEDYDLALAQQLVQGVDLWLNTPRRPWEACGTSGMKVLVNGGLNLSALDGWWAEAYRPDVGWALGDGLEHGSDYDDRDAEELYDLLENQVIPLFYTRNSQGYAAAWLALVRNSMTSLTSRFSGKRMISDYIAQYYLPAAKATHERQSNNNAVARQLHLWQLNLQLHWHQLSILAVNVSAQPSQLQVQARVFLGDINPDAVAVQLIADPVIASSGVEMPAETHNLLINPHAKDEDSVYEFSGLVKTERISTDFTLRIIPASPYAQIPAENSLIIWQER